MDELLVFGYSCKIFRDDGRASSVDKGEYLIPWFNLFSIISSLDILRYVNRHRIGRRFFPMFCCRNVL